MPAFMHLSIVFGILGLWLALADQRQVGRSKVASTLGSFADCPSSSGHRLKSH